MPVKNVALRILDGGSTERSEDGSAAIRVAIAGRASAGLAAKVVFDRVSAGLGLLAVSPVMLGIAAYIWMRDPGPILFAHKRIGKDGEPFPCFKFRTMAVDADEILARHLAHSPEAAREWLETRKLRKDPRVTPLGAVLRRTSLDELPQLLNVLRGEMSLVGPRPIVEQEVRHYGEAMQDYMSVRPGLTGLWQVSGRSDVGYAQRVDLDRAYVRQRSFLGDLGILLRTVEVVLRRKGSY